MSPLDPNKAVAKNDSPFPQPPMLGVITWEAHRKEVEAGWLAAQPRKRPSRPSEKAVPAADGAS